MKRGPPFALEAVFSPPQSARLRWHQTGEMVTAEAGPGRKWTLKIGFKVFFKADFSASTEYGVNF
jgi:hypothetical protein